MLFSSTTLVLVTEKKYFVNQCNQPVVKPLPTQDNTTQKYENKHP
jgi:hypothetical protein